MIQEQEQTIILMTGEKYQETADIYLGTYDEFQFNPYIKNQSHKHKDIFQINEEFDNPPKIFCYPNRLDALSDRLCFFKNKFILITHNSDINIVDNPTNQQIANNENLIKWYAQNLCFEHEKLYFLPIGIANSQWNHGTQFFQFYESNLSNNFVKKNKVYFNFQICTNPNKRQPCYDSLISKLQFLPNTDPYTNVARLAEYEYCICPEGNGMDTHRFWEALYLKCIPIVIRNPMIDIIKKQKSHLPMIILSSWDDFDVEKLPAYKWSTKYEGLGEYVSASIID